MKKLVIIFLCIPFSLIAQLSDGFDDGDFTDDPAWTGSTMLFKINPDLQLQTQASEAGAAWLSTPNNLFENTEWRFRIKLAFSPSANNYARVYLVSDHENLDEALNGYFLQFGESGSNDAIELFRQEGNEVVSVCRGTEGLISTSFEMDLKVIRDGQGYWEIFIRNVSTGLFVSEAGGVDTSFSNTSHFGVFCKYTISNSTKFYFDDFYVGPPIVDLDPPVLNSVKVTDASHLTLQFNEAVDSASALNTENYLVNNSIGHPSSAQFDPIDRRIVQLDFDLIFENGLLNTLQITAVQDLAGNVMPSTITNFMYYRAQRNDIVINEIFADPTPSVGLPEFEFVEIQNLKEFDIDLSGWALVVGGSGKELTHTAIEAGSYLLFGHEEAAQHYSAYGSFYGFSSFSLTNKGQDLMLISKHGDTLSAISYEDSWYADEEKDDGGWTLELVNPENQCSGEANWKASISPTGGTPGAKNSVFSDKLPAPKILQFELVADHILRITFDQTMDLASLSSHSNFSVYPDFGLPDQVFVNPSTPDEVELYFANHFTKSIIYSVVIAENVQSCMHVSMLADTTLQFGIPEPPEENDVIINEILFHPHEGGEDYVELYNRSEKLIDLNRLQLGSVRHHPPDPDDSSYHLISDQQDLFLPAEYLLLSKDPAVVLEQYQVSQRTVSRKMASFPVYSNESGTCILRSSDYRTIDVFSYTEEMHHPLLRFLDGISLERISFDMPAHHPNNWHSASETSGFGTPGLQNSQFQMLQSEDNSGFSIQPEIFSPDNDGYHDIQSIVYNFDAPGYLLTIDIYSAEGHFIANLADNLLVGAEGRVQWDGRQANNSVSPAGIYVFLISVFNTDGETKTYKRTGVLAGKL